MVAACRNLMGSVHICCMCGLAVSYMVLTIWVRFNRVALVFSKNSGAMFRGMGMMHAMLVVW